MNELKECTEKMFEDIKHIDEEGKEYWLARELQSTLGYHQWRHFLLAAACRCFRILRSRGTCSTFVSCM